MLLSDVCLSVAYISRTERRSGRLKLAHVTRTPLSRSKGQKVKGQGHQAALVGCTGRPTWTYSNGHLSMRTWRISCHHLQAWAGAYRSSRPITTCYCYYFLPSVSIQEGGFKNWWKWLSPCSQGPAGCRVAEQHWNPAPAPKFADAND